MLCRIYDNEPSYFSWKPLILSTNSEWSPKCKGTFRSVDAPKKKTREKRKENYEYIYIFITYNLYMCVYLWMKSVCCKDEFDWAVKLFSVTTALPDNSVQ